jgi:uroporphyrinogen-III synthase
MRTVLVIRPRDKWEESRSIVEAHGMKAICASVVRVEYLHPSETAEMMEGLRQGSYGSLVFASVTAVHAFERMAPKALNEVHPGTELVAIGPPTARALRELGASEVTLPAEHTSEGLVELLRHGETPVLMLRSDQGNDVLRKGMEGFRPLRESVVYELHEDRDGLLDAALHQLYEGRVDAVLHTSSLSARLIMERVREKFGEAWRWKAVNAAIGPPTRDTLLSLGLEVQVTSPQATFPELVTAVSRAMAQ